MIKSKRMKLAGHAEGTVEDCNAHVILMESREGKDH
jgi:hypothetical protein